jgi:hypothetical protein
MRRTLAVMVVVWLSVAIAKADDKPTPPFSEASAVAPEQDVRLTKLPNAEPQTIGILTYYPNKGGGYTFMEGKQVAFVALPYLPITATFNNAQIVGEKGKRRFVGPVTIGRIGTSTMPFGGQTFYRSQMAEKAPGLVVRDDTPIATLARDTPGGQFTLSILAEDSETRTKLKSIKPVLERAEHAR